MAAKANREPYFIHEQQRGTWQLLSGTGNPLTGARFLESLCSPYGEEWRATVLAKSGAKFARVLLDGEWVGRVDERGRFSFDKVAEGGAE